MTKAARRLTIAAAVIVAIVVAVRLLLDPIATRQTRDALNELDGFDGDFARVHVTIIPPGYEITRLKIQQSPITKGTEPLFFAEEIRARLRLSSLVRGKLVGDVRIVEPKIALVHSKEKVPAELPPEKKEKAKEVAKAPYLAPQLQKITPFQLARLEILRGELLFRDDTQERRPELWVHRLDLAAEDFATRPKLAGGRAATVTGRGKVGRSGTLTFFVSADPFSHPLAFAGQTAVEGWQARELYDFIAPKAGVQTPEGTIDVFAEFVSKGGRISGGVKPVLKNIEVRPISSGIWDRLKAWLGDKAVELVSDRVPGRNAVATTVPIKGSLSAPDIQLWPAVLGVIRNAFVVGLESGYSNVPPATAQKKEGAVEQAKEALQKSAGPPKAQPVQGRKGGER